MNRPFNSLPRRSMFRPAETAREPAVPSTVAPKCQEKPQNTAVSAGISAKRGPRPIKPLQKRQGISATKYADHPANVALLSGLGRLELSVARFAELIGKPERVAYEWSRGAARPTQEAVTLLAMIEAVPEARDWIEAQHPVVVKPRGRPFTKKPSAAGA